MADEDIRADALPLLAERVRVARLASGKAQDEIARDASLDRTMVGMIERGETNPSVVTLVKLARALGTTPASLLDGIE